jgi:hypothetical protein
MKTMTIGIANSLAALMEQTNNEALPEDVRASAFFLLLDIKQGLIDKQLFEIAAQYKKIEDWNDCPIPFKDLNGIVVLVKT